VAQLPSIISAGSSTDMGGLIADVIATSGSVNISWKTILMVSVYTADTSGVGRTNTLFEKEGKVSCKIQTYLLVDRISLSTENF
jgi:hypothetical protein